MSAIWSVRASDCISVMESLEAVDHVITDPPYSDHVHGKQKRMLRGAGQVGVRDHDLGFAALDDSTRRGAAAHFARLAKRWVLTFSDLESTHLWRDDLVAAGLQHIRVGVWNKLSNQPQLTGDRPAVGCEGVEIAHRPGKKRWSGGGLPARWDFRVETDCNGTGDRVHPTQKPIALMMRLVEQFTDPGDVVLDPFCGSGTTLVACIRLGRRCIGIEKDEKFAAIARERCAAELEGQSLRSFRAGQLPMFGAMP